MKSREYQQKLKETQRQEHIESLEGEKNRARSLNVGNAGSGVTEITMRTKDGSYIWYLMQPVEVIELIHQLSANVGCHLQVTPREDFSSWRNWNPLTVEDKLHLNGHPPHPNDLAISKDVGRTALPSVEKDKVERVSAKEKRDVATKKTVNKRRAK